ncbi:MAG: Flp family type IVb pilin [Sulfuricella sp.]|nr:Flp family type IVb pilin [Sulfuricella sp.]
MEKLILGTKHFLQDEDGLAMVEYGLLAALISVAAVLAITNVGAKVTTTFNTLCQKLNNNTAC